MPEEGVCKTLDSLTYGNPAYLCEVVVQIKAGALEETYRDNTGASTTIWQNYKI